jgi:hypothetical protein
MGKKNQAVKVAFVDLQYIHTLLSSLYDQDARDVSPALDSHFRYAAET